MLIGNVQGRDLRKCTAEEIQVSLLFSVKYFSITIYGNIEWSLESCAANTRSEENNHTYWTLRTNLEFSWLEIPAIFDYVSGDVVDKPIMLEVSDNEGWDFIDTVFQNVGGNNVTVSDQCWRQLIDFIFEG